MHLLLRKSLILAVLVCIQLALCAALADHICPPTRFEQKLRAMERSPDPGIELAIGGASRAYEGINPVSLPWPAYNFGDVGQSPNFTCQVLQRQLDRFSRLKKVILVMDEWSFGGSDTITALDYVKHGYTMLDPKADIGQGETWVPLEWQARWPILRYRRQFLGMALGFIMGRANRHQTPVYDAVAPPDPGEECILAKSGFNYTPLRSPDLSEKAGQERVAHRLLGYTPELRETNFAIYRAFLEGALKRGAQVAIVLPPLHASYRKYADKKMSDEFGADLTRLRQLFPAPQVAVLSYTDTDFPVDEYQDTDHLNGKGATHFGQILTHDLMRLWGKPQP